MATRPTTLNAFTGEDIPAYLRPGMGRYTNNLNDPFEQAQHNFAGPGPAALTAALRRQGLSFGSLGRSGGSPVAGRGPSLAGFGGGDDEAAHSIAVNDYLAGLTDSRAAAYEQEQAADAAGRERSTVQRAAAIANTPNVSQNGRQILQNQDGSYQTAPPTGEPVNRQAVAAQMAPGLIAPPAPDKPVTFGNPEPAMVNGKRVFVRAGSDGLTYDMGRRQIDPATLAPESAAATSVSEQGVELAARNYLTTGVMPPLGMGDKGTRQAILNKAAELGGVGANIAANKADYKADTGSLTTLQRQRDTIGAFEDTAGKNIDIFLNAAGKIVDTGSPLANSLVRNVTGKMLGSPDQAAFDAARQVAVNEIAKITSNPNLTGQLSDSARREVDAFNPREATLAQSVAVMRLLKQDMANRITSLDDAVKNVKGRLRPTDTAPPAPAGFVDMVAPDGRPLHVPDGDVEKVTKAGAKRKGAG